MTVATAEERLDGKNQRVVAGLTVVIAATRFLPVSVIDPQKQPFGDDARDLGAQLRPIRWQP